MVPDAPFPTPEQLDALKAAQARMARFDRFAPAWATFTAAIIPLGLALPIAVWASAYIHSSLIIAVAVGTFMGLQSLGKTWLVRRRFTLANAINIDLLCADNPLDPIHFKEIELISHGKADAIELLAAWVAQNNGQLQMRHLWELRRRFADPPFTTGEVEYIDAIHPNGNALDYYFDPEDKTLPQTLNEVLEGALMSELHAQTLHAIAPPTAKHASARRL